MELKNKNILITGGLGALGSVIANQLKEQGANIFIFDIHDTQDKNFFQVDVTDELEVNNALDKIDKIDILINCAGEIYSEVIFNMMKKERHARESWDRIIQNNLTSCFNVTAQVIEKMLKNRTSGVIINFSSISAQGNTGQSAYSASKAGIEAFTKVTAKEVGMFKIRVCAIAPGFIESPSTTKALSEGMIDYWTKQIPLRRFGQVEDIIKTIRYIIDCDYISGCTLAVDGGLTI